VAELEYNKYMLEFNFEVPVNGASLGQIGVGLLMEMFNRKDELDPNVYVIGGADLRAYNLPEGFQEWLQQKVNQAYSNIGKKLPMARIWHIKDSERILPGSKSVLYTVHECSELTETERDICNFYDQTLVTSNYSNEVFNSGGVKSKVCPNFFDARHFFPIEVKKQQGVTNWMLIGKMEKRKQTHEILSAWAAAYGGNSEHRLNCLIHNGFLPQEMQERSINGLFKGSIPWNINMLGPQEQNSKVNELMNFCDIGINLSGGEGFCLPNINTICLDKVSVTLNAHAHKDYCNEKNSVLVETDGKDEIYDGVFFVKGNHFNQGEMYKCSIESMIDGFKRAEKALKEKSLDTKGVAEKFSVKNTLDIILNEF
jgi:hypothetical protein